MNELTAIIISIFGFLIILYNGYKYLYSNRKKLDSLLTGLDTKTIYNLSLTESQNPFSFGISKSNITFLQNGIMIWSAYGVISLPSYYLYKAADLDLMKLAQISGEIDSIVLNDKTVVINALLSTGRIALTFKLSNNDRVHFKEYSTNYNIKLYK